MNYKSPIEVIQTQLHNSIEGEIYKAVIGVGVHVDKEELMKALQYDRNQYIKGYKDRDQEIVRCQECKHGEPSVDIDGDPCIHCRNRLTGIGNINIQPEWFCAYGERRTE